MRAGALLIVAVATLLGGASPAAPGLSPQATSLADGDAIPAAALEARFKAEEDLRSRCETAAREGLAPAGDCDDPGPHSGLSGLTGANLGGFGAVAGMMSVRRPAPSPPTVNAPFIPWPPPRPSSRAEIPLAQLAPVAARQAGLVGGLRAEPAPAAARATPLLPSASVRTYGDLDRRLRLALMRRGYATAGYFWTPGGYALVTQLERVEDDGTPLAGTKRWARQKDTAAWSLADYVAKLFVGDDGRYRMLLIVVGEEPFGMAGYAADKVDADRWQDSGDTALAAQIKARALTAETTVSLLVYEFRMGKGQIRALSAERDAPLPAQRHLASLGF